MKFALRSATSAAPAPLGLWLMALLIGLWPIVQDASSPTTGDGVDTLIELTLEHRQAVARQFADPGPSAAPNGPFQDRFRASLERLRHQASAGPEPARATAVRIEKEWFALTQALHRGELSSAESFAAHTRLLDALFALQDRLAHAPR